VAFLFPCWKVFCEKAQFLTEFAIIPPVADQKNENAHFLVGDNRWDKAVGWRLVFSYLP
jgi:hypothetical protein